jgi:hypothetical protein
MMDLIFHMLYTMNTLYTHHKMAPRTPHSVSQTESVTQPFDLSSLVGNHVNIHVSYYTGWTFEHRLRQRIREEKDVRGRLYDLTEDATIERSPTGCTEACVFVADQGQMFSWGTGPTLPQSIFLLYADGSMGYHRRENTFHIWMSNAPTWSPSVAMDVSSI